MPQTSPEIAAMFPGMDSEAMEVLKEHFTWEHPEKGFGWITPKDPLYEPTERENYAIVYLIEEWDFGWGGGRVESLT